MTNKEVIKRLCDITDCVGEQYHDGVAEVLLTDSDIKALEKAVKIIRRFDILEEDYEYLREYVMHLEDTIMFYETAESED